MLELRNVSRRFSGSLAVDNVSFRARPGEVTGYLGPNGSGKSTTMKITGAGVSLPAGEQFSEVSAVSAWPETSLPFLISSRPGPLVVLHGLSRQRSGRPHSI